MVKTIVTGNTKRDHSDRPTVVLSEIERRENPPPCAGSGPPLWDWLRGCARVSFLRANPPP